MKRTINLDLVGGDAIKYIKLSAETTIDPVVQRVLTLLMFSIENYVKTEDGLTVMETLTRCNSGDIHQVAALMSDVMANVKDAINEDEHLIESLDISLSVEGTAVKAVINTEKVDGEIVSTAIY